MPASIACFGLDPVEVDKTWHAELPIHWILEAPNVAGVVPAGVDLVDHAAFLDAIASGPAPRAWACPFATFQQRRQDLLVRRAGPSTLAPGASADQSGPAPSSTMWPGDLMRALSDAMPPTTIVATDVGSHKYLFGQFWPSRLPGRFWMSNGLSGMAYGLSAAIGAKLAHPDELAAAVRRAVEQNRSLVVGVPVNYADYKLLF